MSTKKFIISIVCALVVLIALSVFTVIFTNAHTHRSVLMGRWEDANLEDQVSITIEFDQNDKYERQTISVNAETGEIEEKIEKGTYSVFNGKITLTNEDGKKEIITYSYSKSTDQLEIANLRQTHTFKELAFAKQQQYQ